MNTSLSPSELPKVQPQMSRYIAPWWHTVALVLFLLVFSAMGSAGHPGLDHSLRMKLYVGTIVMEWLMVLFIVWGLQRTKASSVRELIGGRWKTAEDFLLDIAVAVAFWITAALVLITVGYALGMNSMTHVKDMESRIGSMLPDGGTEISVWLLLCITAGFCEEVIFRGYLQKQFAGLVRSAWGGAVLQALIFGGSHAYEGWKQMVRIAVFGFLFGALALWRRSLRPGMMAHFAQDTLTGVLGRWALKQATNAMPK